MSAKFHCNGQCTCKHVKSEVQTNPKVLDFESNRISVNWDPARFVFLTLSFVFLRQAGLELTRDFRVTSNCPNFSSGRCEPPLGFSFPSASPPSILSLFLSLFHLSFPFFLALLMSHLVDKSKRYSISHNNILYPKSVFQLLSFNDSTRWAGGLPRWLRTQH